MVYVAHHVAVLLVCLLAGRWLGRAAWVRAAPRLAIACWQVVWLAGVLSALGALFALALMPYRLGVLPALVRLGGDLAAGRPVPLGLAGAIALAAALAGTGWLAVALLVCATRAVRVRHRHRLLLALVGQRDDRAPGATVLDHPLPAVYCLPGTRTVVISRGALGMFDADHLSAVLAHEDAHLAERHDLVLLPFAALCWALPGVRAARAARAAVSLAVEMCADDRARSAPALAEALLRFGAAAPTPPGTLGAAQGAVAMRADRLLRPARRVPRVAWLGWCVGLAAVLGTPLSLLVLPL